MARWARPGRPLAGYYPGAHWRCSSCASCRCRGRRPRATPTPRCAAGLTWTTLRAGSVGVP
eukprot:9295891-Lingulodinium_polyedra.AAC.1